MDSEKAKDEVMSCIRLQTLLFSLDESQMEILHDFIKSSIFIHKNRLKSLSHNFLHLIDYRPQKIPILIDFIQNLIQTNPKLSIIEIIFNEIIKTRPNCSRLFFIHQCIARNLISENQIIPYINSFDYFLWFAPIVDRLNHPLFEYFISRKDENLFIQTIEEFSKDNWGKHKHFASTGMNHHEVARLIRIDDIENLKKVPHLNVNMRLPTSPFESIDILNHGCTLLHYATYFNSIECYKEMIEKGASPYATDFNGQNCINFAVAGESLTILNELLKSSSNESESLFKKNLTNAILCSAIYHQSILNDHSNFVSISSLFLNAAASDNLSLILNCIENNVDVNCANHSGETALIIAATNNHKELVNFLLSTNLIDPTKSDTFGRNALICAIDKDNLDIVNILMDDDRIDINSSDIFELN